MSDSILVSTNCDSNLSEINKEKLCYRCKKSGHYAWQCNRNNKYKLKKIMDIYDYTGFLECEKLGSLTPGYIMSLIGKMYPIKVFNYLKRWNRYHGNMPGINKKIDEVIKNIWRKHDLKYKNYNALAKAMYVEERIESDKLREVIKQITKNEITKEFSDEVKDSMTREIKRVRELNRAMRKSTTYEGEEPYTTDFSIVDKNVRRLADKKTKEYTKKEQKIVEFKKGVTQDVMERAMEEDELNNERAEAFRLKKDLQNKKIVQNKFFNMLKNTVEKKKNLKIHEKLNQISLNMESPENLTFVTDQVISGFNNRIDKLIKIIPKFLRDRAVLQLCKNDLAVIDKQNQEIENEIESTKLTRKGLTKKFMEEKTNKILQNTNEKTILASIVDRATEIVQEKQDNLVRLLKELKEYMKDKQLGSLIVPDNLNKIKSYTVFYDNQLKKMKGLDISKYDFSKEEMD